MADEPDNVVLQHLRALRAQFDTFGERQMEMVQRIGTLETHVSNLGLQQATLAVQVANISVRVDRVEARLDRIERRLGLIEEHA